LEAERSLTKSPPRGNPFASPFAHDGWLYLTLGLAGVAVVLITVVHAA
jgi:hypothetical protein